MKKEVMAQTSNVKHAISCLEYLIKRPKTEMVGLGLLYGAPGLGKSRFARRTAINNDWIYIRLESTETAKTFATKLYGKLTEKYSISSILHGSTNKIFDGCIDLINDIEEDVVIFIDEIDYAFRDKKLLGAIRDIVDSTLAIIVLIGMQQAKKMLLRANAHYFDRCNYFFEFKSLKLVDVGLVCRKVSNIKMDDDVVKFIAENSKGTLRKIIKLIHSIETIAKSKQLNAITLQDMYGVLK